MPDIFLSLPFYGAAVSAAIMTPAILLQESIELDDEEEDAETIANRFIALKETLPDDAPSSASIERLCVPTSIRLPSPTPSPPCLTPSSAAMDEPEEPPRISFRRRFRPSRRRRPEPPNSLLEC